MFLCGRLVESVSRRMTPLRVDRENGRAGGLNITIIITCVFPLLCLSGVGLASLLFGCGQVQCQNIASSADNVWTPTINLSDRYVVQLDVHFPISHQFLTRVTIKNGSTTIINVSGPRNICRMRHHIFRCHTGVIDKNINNNCRGRINSNETQALEDILNSVVIC
jgi:hypothetical protein